MTTLHIQDLDRSATLDNRTMASVRGGLNAVIDNSQSANQVVVGGNGPVFAINSPVSAPSTVLTESNPFTSIDLTNINLIGSYQNALSLV